LNLENKIFPNIRNSLLNFVY